MLIQMRLADGIRSGSIEVAFRSWKRPTVKAGGTLTITAIGQMAIDSVTPIDVSDITRADAVLAGEADLDALMKHLRIEPDRTMYRIDFHYVGEDPRIALRAAGDVTKDEIEQITARLSQMDSRAADGPWTMEFLHLIGDNPATVSTDLAASVGMERIVFKRKVRQLKTLGLTESLSPGYRLSPRAEAYLAAQSS
jgi:hypothetical protein